MSKIDRSLQPQAGEFKDIKFPKYHDIYTENGINLIVIEDKRIPVITVRFLFKTGSCGDALFGIEKSGLASVTSELLTKGTSKHSAVDIAEFIDYFGASISTGCDSDATYISSYSLTRHFEKIFNFVSNLILDSVFPEDELERIKNIRYNNLLSYLDEGGYLAGRAFKKNVYKNSPYALNTEGTINSVNNITRNDLIKFCENFYTPDNLIIAVVGDINKESALKIVNENFGEWKTSRSGHIEISDVELNNKTRAHIVSRESSVQSDVILGHISIRRNHVDFIPVSVMNTLFGGYFTSRVNKQLREEKGFTYGARSYINWKKHSGDFFIETSVNNKITINAIETIIQEMYKLKNEMVSEQELENVKRYISGSFPLQLETPNSIATRVINLKVYNVELNFYDTYLSKINSTTCEDIYRVSQEHLHPENLTIAVAGKPDDIINDLKQNFETEVIEDINSLN